MDVLNAHMLANALNWQERLSLGREITNYIFLSILFVYHLFYNKLYNQKNNLF
jgi:hypothetical protein